MNWSQIYNSLTPEERIEAAIIILQTIEARQSKLVLAKGRLLRERRRALLNAHYINNRRRIPSVRSTLYRSAFIFTLLTASIGVWLVAFHIPPSYAAPLMFLHLAALSAILLIKPYKPRLSLANDN